MTDKDEKKLNALRDYVKSLIGEDNDKFDTDAEADLSLNLNEAKRELKEKLIQAGLYKDQKALEAYSKAQEAKMIYERNIQALQEVKAYNEGLKALPQNKQIEAYYLNLIRAVRKVASGYSFALYVKGPGGHGKTFQCTNTLLAAGAKYVEIRGDVTPAYLYRLAYENNDKILYLNDTAKLLRQPDSLNMLKAMTELTGARKVMRLSYSKQQDDLPPEFIFSGAVIFDYNYVEPSVRVDLEALQSRGDYVEVNHSPDDMKQLMRLIAKEEWQQEVTEYVIERYEYNGQNPLNLRTQAKAFNTYKYAIANGLDWKQEIEAELQASRSKIRNTLYGLIGNTCVKVSKLVKLLVMSGEVGAIRTGYTRIQEWLLIEELYKVSSEGKDFYVCINPIQEPDRKVNIPVLTTN